MSFTLSYAKSYLIFFLVSVTLEYSTIIFAVVGLGMWKIGREKEILKLELASLRKDVSLILGTLVESRFFQSDYLSLSETVASVTFKLFLT